MSLLAPLFLIGALAVAGPLVAHLVRRRTRDRILFSATHLLEPSAPRLDRRSRIEHPWLLALRCLAVLVLAAGFSRPFLREAPPPLDAVAPVRHRVIVLDVSASMQRSGLWPAAVAEVRTAATDLRSADVCAIVTAGRSARVPLPAEAWMRTGTDERIALVNAVIEDLRPGWEATHLDTGIDRALEELSTMREAGPAPVESVIVVVSDFAEGARISSLAGREWPDGVRVQLQSIEDPRAPNAAIHWLGWTRTPDGARQARLRVSHDAFDSRSYRLAARTADGAAAIGEARDVVLASREARALAIDVPADASGAFRVDLSGDDEPYDNTVWIVPPATRRFTIPYWGSGDADDPKSALYFITRAVRGWRDPDVSIGTAGTIEDGVSTAPTAPLHLVARSLAPAEVAALRAQVEAGATVLVLARDAAIVATAGALIGEPGWSAAPGGVDSNSMFGDIRFAHPLFAPFADPRFSDFTRVRFWSAPRIEVPDESRATAVARFDSGAPAVLEATPGLGAIVVWAGDWTPASSQWVLSTRFVPWFQSLALRAIGGPPRPTMAEVGEVAAVPARDGAMRPDQPGVFDLPESTGPGRIALNVPAAESRTAPLALDAWERLGVPLTDTGRVASQPGSTARSGSTLAARLESEQRLWRWLLLTSIIILAVESVVAIRASARRTASHPA